MDVPPLDPVYVLVQLALVGVAAFATICGLTAYVRAHPPRKPDGSPIEGHLRSLYASPDPFVLILAALACVVVILATGVIGFARGGEFNRKHGNRLMRWRLIAQAVAIAVFLLYLWARSKEGKAPWSS